MGHLNDIQTALKPLKKSEEIEYIFMIILELAELFETMSQHDPTVTLSYGLFIRKYQS